MNSPSTMGDVIQAIIREHGEAALLDLSFTMTAFEKLAPDLKKEGESLRALLLCGGAEKLLQVRNSSAQEQKYCMDELVKRMKDEQWVTESAARRACSEFYRGLSGSEWSFTSGETRNGGQETNLNVYKTITIQDPKKAAGKQITIDLGTRKANVYLPDDLTDGQILCFRKNGRQDPAKGLAGDLYVTVHIAPAPAGRRWVKYAVAAAAVVLVFLFFPMRGNETPGPQEDQFHQDDSVQSQTIAHTHSWQDATCTAPKTCTACGETSGNAAGHQWQDVDCTSPQICAVCGETSGSVAGHRWQDATYSSPARCEVCGITDGLSLGTPVIQCKVLDDSQSSKKTDIITGTLRDEAGERYENAVKFWVIHSAGFYDVEHIVYELAGEYDLLQGVIALEENSASGAGVRFYIYGDGTLLFKSEYIQGTELESFEIDVSGVKELRIECETDESRHGYGLLQATLYVA